MKNLDPELHPCLCWSVWWKKRLHWQKAPFIWGIGFHRKELSEYTLRGGFVGNVWNQQQNQRTRVVYWFVCQTKATWATWAVRTGLRVASSPTGVAHTNGHICPALTWGTQRAAFPRKVSRRKDQAFPGSRKGRQAGRQASKQPSGRSKGKPLWCRELPMKETKDMQ